MLGDFWNVASNDEGMRVFTMHVSVLGLVLLLVRFKLGTLGTFTGTVLCTVTTGLQDKGCGEQSIT